LPCGCLGDKRDLMESLVEKIFWMTINCYHEARGEPFAGKVAVCKVVLNRTTDDRWPDTVKDVIWQSSQFSWTLNKKLFPLKNYNALLSCAKAALRAYMQWMVGGTMSGVNHYHTVDVHPSWDRDMVLIDRIYSHLFFRG